MKIAFFIFAFITILTALFVVTTKNPIHSVMGLIVTFFSISGHYVLMNAQFLAIVNLIVYAGAIMVLFLFVLMLLNLNKESEPVKAPLWGVGAAIASGLLLITVAAATRGAGDIMLQNKEAADAGLVKTLGKVLFSKYVVPFEISSILFLSAMVGAVLLGKREKGNDTLEVVSTEPQKS